MSEPYRTGIFIVACNAESRLEQTLARISREIWDRIEEAYVIDDCSTDETVQCAMRLATQYPKLRVLRNRTNRRYGGSQKVGFQYAIDRGFDAVAILHADGYYAPELLSRILAPLEAGGADVVLGVRLIGGADGAATPGIPLYKLWGNRVLTRIQNRLSGMALRDFHSGYRAYRVAFLRSIPFWDNTDEWHFDTEVLLQAKARQAQLVEVPVPVFHGREIHHLNGWAYAWGCLRATFRQALHRSGLCYARPYDLNASGSRYSSKFADPYSSHTLLYRHLQQQGLAGKTVLELGVGDTALTRRLHALGVAVDCIEVDPEAVRAVTPYARQVWNVGLDIVCLDRILERYDIIVAADILEHLLYPEEILSKLKTCAKKGGRLLVSLPNVANIYVRLNLLLGRFPYHSKGLLDRTHLHFYTRKSAERLITQTGWEIVARDYASIPVAMVFPFLRKRGFRFLLHLLRGATRLWRGLFCYQYLLYCRNPNESALL